MGEAIEKPTPRIVEAVGRATRRHWGLLLVALLSSAAEAKPPSAHCVTQCEPGFIAECVAVAATPSPTAASPTPTRIATAQPTATRTATPTPTPTPTPAVAPTAAPTVPPSAFLGWGSSTTGGSGKPIVHVTNLNDSGTGSLRSALSSGNRTIVFDVTGTINLASDLYVSGAFITVDGKSAPSPGITLNGSNLRVDGASRHDIIITNLRLRNCGLHSSEGDCITVKNGVYNVVIDHVSTDRPTDGNIDLTHAHDITVQNSILSNGTVAMIAGNTVGTTNPSFHMSIHHNLFINEKWRNPCMGWADNSVAPDTMADVRNNVIWNWGDNGGGTIWQCGATGNTVANYYWSGAVQEFRKQWAILTDCSGTQPVYYTAGNVHGDYSSDYINKKGTTSTPFEAPSIGETDACTAARYVKQNVGARPLDSIDQAFVDALTLPAC